MLGDSSAMMTSGWELQPLTLWAGVGRVVVEEVMEVETLVTASDEVAGEKCEGLWGV